VALPRAADDFTAIRARMEELRRERAGVPAEGKVRRPDVPEPNEISSRAPPAVKPGLSPELRRTLLRGRSA
jgi:hypothetical protein